MFVYHGSSHTMVLLLYVDDIILTGNDSSSLKTFISIIGSDFEIKALGRLHYFLGIEVQSLGRDLLLPQTKYTLDILKRCRMLECKPCPTPVASKNMLTSTT